MAYNNLSIQDVEKIRIITISREEHLNALNAETINELHQAIRELEKDQAIRVGILTGAGDKAFVAGADIKAFADYNTEEGEFLAREGQRLVFDAIHHASKPFIAAINGFALGGGLELAMACHLRFASVTAKLGLPEVTLGLIPGYGGTQRFTQLVGRGKAMELILTAEMISSEEAARIGLINAAVVPTQLLEHCMQFANTVASRSSTAVSAAIEAINASLDPRQDGFDVEIKRFGQRFGTKDFQEGVSAFLEKRKPNF